MATYPIYFITSVMRPAIESSKAVAAQLTKIPKANAASGLMPGLLIFTFFVVIYYVVAFTARAFKYATAGLLLKQSQLVA